MISLSDIKSNLISANCVSEIRQNTVNGIVHFANKSMAENLPILSTGSTYIFASDKEWSTPDLLQHLLSITGPADLAITTYSVTDLAVTQFKNILATGQIKSCRFVADRRVMKVAPLAFKKLEESGIELKFRKCHAKMILISNDQYKVTVISSANFHRNPRWEAGTIFTCMTAYDFALLKFNEIWN